MRPFHFIYAWIFLALAVVPVLSQDETEEELMSELNRIQYLLHSAHNKIIATNALEPVESQIAAFKDLEKRKEQINESIEDSVKGTAAERKAKMLALLTQLRELERELKEDILLPHQVDQIRFAEFDRLMLLNRGNIADVIQTYYEKDFKLTDGQRKKLKALRQEMDAERAKIRLEYNKKLNEVEAKTRLRMGKIFTKEQIATIEKASGKKLVEKKSTDGSD